MTREESKELLVRCDELGAAPGVKAQVVSKIMNGGSRLDINAFIDKQALSTRTQGQQVTNGQTGPSGTDTRQQAGPITSFSQISDEGFVRTILQPTLF